MMKTADYISLLFVLTALLSGCRHLTMTIEQVKSRFHTTSSPTPHKLEQALPEKYGVLMGKVIGEASTRKRVVVIAFSHDLSRNRIGNYTVLPEPGPYLLYVPEGIYNILVFVDVNDNFICEANESVGQHENPDTIRVSAGEVVGELNIVISSAQIKPFDSPVELKVSQRQDRPRSLEDGGTVHLDDKIFSRKYGSIGLWDPSKFIKEVGVDVYARDAFDETKTPILFVHGSGGTPRDWEFIVNRINEDCYQPWFFYYPSGLRLKTLADLLHERLDALYNKYKFHELCITAHSMGGLIVRSFIDRHEFDAPGYDLKLFVSISTPWGGIDRAGLAKEHRLFVFPPSWKDLASGSEFIDNLFQKRIPPKVNFCLFFGYKGDNLLLKGADDGSVALKSQLDFRAQLEATRSYGFNENHVTILFSEEVFTRYSEVLYNIRRCAEQRIGPRTTNSERLWRTIKPQKRAHSPQLVETMLRSRFDGASGSVGETSPKMCNLPKNEAVRGFRLPVGQVSFRKESRSARLE